jgi:hypothetical protein
MNCNDVHDRMADLLFEGKYLLFEGKDPLFTPEEQKTMVAKGKSGQQNSIAAEVESHLAACESCSQELAGLRATMTLLDDWKAPEPNPYFLTRLNARLGEQRASAPAGWARSLFEKMRARVLYGTQVGMRPVAAMALTIMVLVGGGAYLGVNELKTPPAQPVAQAAVVDDLQTLDNNAQLLDQLESLSDQNND